MNKSLSLVSAFAGENSTSESEIDSIEYEETDEKEILSKDGTGVTLTPQEIQQKKIDLIYAPADTLAVYKRLGYKHQTDPAYRRIRIQAERALAQEPLRFYCNMRWSSIKKKATRELLVSKVEAAIGLDRDICLAMIIGLIETKCRKIAKPLNDQIKAQGLKANRGRPPAHGRYVGRVRKNKIGTVNVLEDYNSSTSDDETTGSVTNDNVADSLSLSATHSVALPLALDAVKQSSTKSQNKEEANRSKKARLAALQEKAHTEKNNVQTKVSLLSKPQVQNKNFLKKGSLSAFESPNVVLHQGANFLEEGRYDLFQENVGKVTMGFRYTLEEFFMEFGLDVPNDTNRVWYKYGNGSNSIIDCTDTYARFLSTVKEHPKCIPTISLPTEKDWESPNDSDIEDSFSNILNSSNSLEIPKSAKYNQRVVPLPMHPNKRNKKLNSFATLPNTLVQNIGGADRTAYMENKQKQLSSIKRTNDHSMSLSATTQLSTKQQHIPPTNIKNQPFKPLIQSSLKLGLSESTDTTHFDDRVFTPLTASQLLPPELMNDSFSQVDWMNKSTTIHDSQDLKNTTGENNVSSQDKNSTPQFSPHFANDKYHSIHKNIGSSVKKLVSQTPDPEPLVFQVPTTPVGKGRPRSRANRGRGRGGARTRTVPLRSSTRITRSTTQSSQRPGQQSNTLDEETQ
ncbi:hypothetical protein EDC01DRAFT_764860 [Geopyxis carbonaria]|nr:hypothetical protein EDC01DRAFT_764860 [Geopyxis carbonaria]